MKREKGEASAIVLFVVGLFVVVDEEDAVVAVAVAVAVVVVVVGNDEDGRVRCFRELPWIFKFAFAIAFAFAFALLVVVFVIVVWGGFIALDPTPWCRLGPFTLRPRVLVKFIGENCIRSSWLGVI